MKVRIYASRLLVCAVALTVSVGCGGARADEYWQSGSSYELRIIVEQRPSPLPGVPVPPSDSLRLVIALDSAMSDSLFGRYEGALDSVGVFTGDRTIGSQLVAMRTWPDSFALVLAPNVMDAQVIMSGRVRDGVGAGTWRQLTPAAPAGRFSVSRIPR